jgi:hypothetical protein
MNERTSPQIESLEGLIERLRAIDDDVDPVELHVILQQIEQRSFGAILIIAGIIVLAPIIGDIPGVPTVTSLLVVITAGQILAGRRYFWLPQFLLRRSVKRRHLQGALDFMLRPARFTDRFLFQRLSFLSESVMTLGVAAAALGVGLVMPVLELIPFTANIAGIALFAFGAALIARDGLFALLSLALTGTVFVLVVDWILGA